MPGTNIKKGFLSYFGVREAPEKYLYIYIYREREINSALISSVKLIVF